MPRLARLFIKTSLVYLVAALLAAVLVAAGPVVTEHVLTPLYPTYLHLFVVGWLTQLIFGVAFWLFPRRSRDDPYGRQAYATASYVLLNLGLLMRTAAEPAAFWQASEAWDWTLAASALLQWAGTLLYAVYIWSRVKTK